LVIKTIQDDDPEIREIAISIVAKEKLGKQEKIGVENQVEKAAFSPPIALRYAFDFLDKCGRREEVTEILWSYIEEDGAIFNSPWIEKRRTIVFEREKDNLHEEPVLVCQNATYCLSKTEIKQEGTIFENTKMGLKRVNIWLKNVEKVKIIVLSVSHSCRR